MKKTSVFLIIFLGGAASFSAFPQNRNIFFEGTALVSEHTRFFLENFRMEAAAMGYNSVDHRGEAAYSFRFNVEPNVTVYDDGYVELPSPDEKRFTIVITLIRNEDDTELVSFGFPFTELAEMYDYIQYLFLKAAVYIPQTAASQNEGAPSDPGGENQNAPGGETIVRETIIRETITRETVTHDGAGPEAAREGAAEAPQERPPAREDYERLNKWLFLRGSFGLPITFYQLQETGLISGIGVYDGSYDKPNRVSPLDNKVLFLPAMTLGLEAKFLDYMSAELNFSAAWEHLHDQDFLNLEAGLELKFPLNLIDNVYLDPYLAFSLPLPNPVPIPFSADLTIFDAPGIFEKVAVGGGGQIGVKAGKSGIAFLDISFLYTLNDIAMNNYLGELYPEPPLIYYRRSVIRLGIGYKFGLFDR